MTKKHLLTGLVILVFSFSFPWVYIHLRGLKPILAPAPGAFLPSTPYNSTGLPLSFPPGFKLSYYATDLTDPRVLIFDPANTLLVSLTSTGQVITLPDKHVVLSGLNKPHGLAFYLNSLYVAETNSVSIYDYDSLTKTATHKRKILDLPADGEHFSRSLLITNRQLYISIGSDCNACTETDPHRAGVFISDLLGHNFRPFSTGLRNSVFLVTNPATSDIWATEMGRDYLGDNLPPDEINILRDGQNYGWPDCWGQNLPDCSSPKFTPSHIDIPAHSAPLGLAFIPDSWPKNYRGNLLVAYHGSWNRTVPTGYKIALVKLDKFGNSIGITDFLSGWLTPDYSALGRPVSLVFDTAGNLFISDDKRGVVYELTPPPPAL